MSKRAELIERLRRTEYDDLDACKAADMLEAAAALAEKRVAAIAADREYWREQAQQVAVPASDLELSRLYHASSDSFDFARKLEAHHKIGVPS